MNRVGFGQSSFALKATGFTSKVNLDDAILALFKGGKQGVWYDPSDKSTLFQNVAGTVPVTKDGDPVALMRDKSGNGNHAKQTVSAARPIYKTDGVLHWFEGDGIDDIMASDKFLLPHPLFVATAASIYGPKGLLDGLLVNSSSLVIDAGRVRLYSGGSAIYYTDPIIESGKNYVYTGQFNGANSYVAANNSSPMALETLHKSDVGGVTIMGLAGGTAGTAMRGRYYGTVVVNKIVTELERQKVIQYFAAKSGVTL